MGERLVRMSVVGQGGIVDERHLAGEGEVALRGVLVRVRGGACTLVVPAGSAGQIAQEAGRPLPLPEGAIALGDAARAWVQRGAARVLVQVTQAPERRPEPALPKEVRAGWRGAMERSFTAVLVGVMALEGTAVVAVRRLPEVPLDAAPMELDEYRPISHPAIFTADVSATQKPPKTSLHPTHAFHDGPRDPERVRAEVGIHGLLKVIGAAHEGGLGTVFAPTQGIGQEVAEAFDHVHPGQMVATSEGPSMKEGSGPRDVRISDSFGPTPAGPRPQLTERVRPKIDFDPGEEGCRQCGADPDLSGIAAQIRLRVSGIQRCYERALKLRQDLHGRLVVRFTVAPSGRVSEVDFDEDRLQDAEVTGCIRQVARGWALGVHPPEALEVAFPFVFSAGQ